MANYICPDLFKSIVEFVPLADLKYLSKASPIFDNVIANTIKVGIVYGRKNVIILRPKKDIVIRTAGNVLRIMWPHRDRYINNRKVNYLHCTNEHDMIVSLAKKYRRVHNNTVWFKMIGDLYTIVEKPPKKLCRELPWYINTLISVSFCEIIHKNYAYINMHYKYLVQDIPCNGLCITSARKIIVTEFKVLYEDDRWK